MGEHTGKHFVYLTQKQGRDTHPKRKGMGILSNEEECNKLELTWVTHPERSAGILNEAEHNKEVI